MNILFLTMVNMSSFDTKSTYTDLLRVFIRKGHSVVVICPQKRNNKELQIIESGTSKIVKIPTGDLFSSNPIKKGLATVDVERRFTAALKKMTDRTFDLLLYSTPPITFSNAVKYIKKRDGLKTYLLLKDIFPQNAVDLGMLSDKGPKSVVWRYFRRKEKELYAISDAIGCMSPANCRYLTEHNPEVDPAIVEVCPNIADPDKKSVTEAERREIRDRYGIPQNKRVFVYGGNLGKPQGIPFLIECLRKQP